ncbi:hypothetical protein [Mucilaginibacter sp. PAMB04168]|uniref:DUF1281 family ferredoxin-like fold protein n=1 Tax=Mucilaginibacter sp. PAMB04168 TaxID=3138567 RepID=UPI0031F7199A
MANWCSNSVVFQAEPAQLLKIQTLFLQMAALAEHTGDGQLPPFIREQDGYFFDIAWEEDVLYYATKWVPNTDHLVKVSEHFGADFRHYYAETSSSVYGVAIYQDGIMTITDLDNSDFDHYDLDPETGLYHFEGCTYESSEEILDMLIRRKQQINDLTD